MDSKEQADRLIVRLTDLTRSDKIHWEETANRTTFLTGFADFVGTLSKLDDPPATEAYELEIADHFGKTIETIVSSPSRTTQLARLRQLYNLAAERAMRSARPLSDVLASLEQIR
jgi:hypothetical protein